MSHNTLPTPVHIGDTFAIAGAVTTFFGWLPDIAALFSLVWITIRLFEAFTGKLFHETRLAKFLTGR